MKYDELPLEVIKQWARILLQAAVEGAEARGPKDKLSAAELAIAPRSAGGAWPIDSDFEERPEGLARKSWWGRDIYPHAPGHAHGFSPPGWGNGDFS